jgi:hypothetical protein
MFKSSLLDVSAQFILNGLIGGGNRYGHGTLKVFPVAKRRTKSESPKLSIAFSEMWRSHRSQKLEGYKEKCQKFSCDQYTSTYNEICVANHIKPLITKELTFYSCFPFK